MMASMQSRNILMSSCSLASINAWMYSALSSFSTFVGSTPNSHCSRFIRSRHVRPLPSAKGWMLTNSKCAQKLRSYTLVISDAFIAWRRLFSSSQNAANLAGTFRYDIYDLPPMPAVTFCFLLSSWCRKCRKFVKRKPDTAQLGARHCLARS